MNCREIEKELTPYYRAVGEGPFRILPNMMLDGDGAVFFLHIEGRELTLTTDEVFKNYYIFGLGSELDYLPYLDKICARFGVAWDRETYSLSLHFRRNDMTLAEALTKLESAARLIAGLGENTFVRYEN